MDVKEEFSILHCYSCLSSNEDNKFQFYRFKNSSLKTILQVEGVNLCYLCKRRAQNADSFIQNVEKNQAFLQNINIITDNINSIKNQTLSVNGPVAVIDATSDLKDDESFTIYSSCKNWLDIKLEMKDEDHINLEGAFVDDDDITDQFVKTENSDDIPLVSILKNDVHFKVRNIKKRKLKKSKLKNKIRKERKEIEDDTHIEMMYISKKDCMEERKKMSLEEKYLNSTYKCEDCIKGFNFKESYDKHMERHCKSNGEYECDICKQRVISEDKLMSHMRYHQVRYKCVECNLTRTCRLTIKDHYTAFHADGQMFLCQQCGKSYKRRTYLRKHIAYAHTKPERVTCSYCMKSYANKDVLKLHFKLRHVKEVSGVEIVKKHVCEECGMAFRALSLLKIHSIKHSHRRDYYCIECDKTFKSVASLNNHLKTAAPHVNYVQLPLQCTYCEKKFAIKRDLERHMNRIHLNIRPYQCDKCDKAYVNSWSLREHARFAHEGHKRPLKYPCPMCDKAFARNQILKSHLRTHTGERPYHCSECPAKFSQRSILGTHMKLVHLKLTRDGKPKAVTIK